MTTKLRKLLSILVGFIQVFYSLASDLGLLLDNKILASLITGLIYIVAFPIFFYLPILYLYIYIGIIFIMSLVLKTYNKKNENNE